MNASRNTSESPERTTSATLASRPWRGPHTCVLGTDKGHLVGVRLEADEATLSVHWLVRVRMEGIEPGREIRDHEADTGPQNVL